MSHNIQSSEDIRESFIKYFLDNGHVEKKSSSLIPNDSSLLLTAAGMVQFKDYFLGNEISTDNRLTTIQKCVRTSDIDIIGESPRHLSFFEMLGNFSIDNYFKKEAIEYAHSYVTEILKVPEDHLWYTVYKNDEEAKEIWIDEIGVNENKVQKGDKDNFWHMNTPGPCGPCTEIFVDRGESFGSEGGPIGGSEDRYIEIWNLVFMELIQDEPYEVVGKLPFKNVDTGMGLERIAMILQNKRSIFETDLFFSTIKEIETLHKIKYGTDTFIDKQVRIIADHLRASTFLISDGVVPTNESRGYVLRRLIRRLLRSSFQLNNMNNDLTPMIQGIVKQYSTQYSELSDNSHLILDSFNSEQELFYKTLKKGHVLVNNLISTNKQITAKDAFKLYDTYGFPFELTNEIAKENNINIDKIKYDNIVKKNKSKSNKGLRTVMKDSNEFENTEFVGYEYLDTDALITAVNNKSINELVVYTDKTTLYYQSGGQVSDQGILIYKDKSYPVAELIQMSNGAIGHVLKTKDVFEQGSEITISVDQSFRNGASKSHTAAHIVHASLRKILGEGVAQAGSNVEPGKLRFDFSYSKKISTEILADIFDLSNKVIFDDTQVNTNIMNIEEAKKEGALAFFGDKYGENVRVIDVGTHSKELCGGTHVKNSSNIGLVVLTNESSIGSNLRRIEMLSGLTAYEYLLSAKKSLSTVSNLLRVQENKVLSKLELTLNQYDEISLIIKQNRKDSLSSIIKNLHGKSKKVGQTLVLVEIVDFHNTNEAKNILANIMAYDDISAGIILNYLDGKYVIVGAANSKSNIDISTYVQEASHKVSGGASKDPKYSVGGGPGKYLIELLKEETFTSISNDIK